MSNDYNKKAPVEAGANRRSDLNQYGTHSSNWDRQLQDRMDQSGAPRGGRNIEMVKLACDIVWAGLLTENEYSLKIKDGFPEGWQTRVPKMMVPTGTMTSPQEVAKVIAFWLSDDSKPFSGTVFELEQYPFAGRIPTLDGDFLENG